LARSDSAMSGLSVMVSEKCLRAGTSGSTAPEACALPCAVGQTIVSCRLPTAVPLRSSAVDRTCGLRVACGEGQGVGQYEEGIDKEIG
jgi:hypothetical protein